MTETDRISEFIEYISATGVSDNTKQAYERDLRIAKRYLDDNGVCELADIGSADLMQYIEYILDQGRSAATVSRNIASMRRFFAFTHSRGYTFSDPSELLKAPKVIRKTPDILSEKDIRRLIGTVDQESIKGIRDRAILELLAGTGISVSEILALDMEDVDLRTRMMFLGDEKRMIELSKKLCDILKKYMNVRHKLAADAAECEAFFLSCAGGRMSRQGLWKLIHLCGKNAGIENMTPKILRHSFAVAALKHGKDVSTVQKMLGHTSRTGTMEYRSLADEL